MANFLQSSRYRLEPLSLPCTKYLPIGGGRVCSETRSVPAPRRGSWFTLAPAYAQYNRGRDFVKPAAAISTRSPPSGACAVGGLVQRGGRVGDPLRWLDE